MNYHGVAFWSWGEKFACAEGDAIGLTLLGEEEAEVFIVGVAGGATIAGPGVLGVEGFYFMLRGTGLGLGVAVLETGATFGLLLVDFWSLGGSTFKLFFWLGFGLVSGFFSPLFLFFRTMARIVLPFRPDLFWFLWFRWLLGPLSLTLMGELGLSTIEMAHVLFQGPPSQ